MRVFLKTGPYYTGVNPNPIAHASGDAQFCVYFNRPGEPNAGSGWEAVELTPHDGGQFDARYIESNRQLSIGDDGSLQSRAAGAIGPWETFFCTTQPDGSNLLYRLKDGALLAALTIKEAS